MRATNSIRVLLSFALVLSTLPTHSHSQVTKDAKAKPERRLKSLPRPQELPNIAEVKEHGKTDKTKLPVPVEPQLPAAERCRPADEICQEVWRKKGIGQTQPSNSFAASLGVCWYSIF